MDDASSWRGIDSLIVSASGNVTVIPKRRDDDIVELLRSLVRCLGDREKPSAETTLIDRAAVAKLLGVSTRTVARLIRPTSQPRNRGKAWYDPADVERQLRALGPSASKRASTARQPGKRSRSRPSRATRHLDTTTEARITAVEQKLLTTSSKE